ncbi:hypothetical protein WJX81_002588 [Elliptochloris bilobata]|uniref:L-2-hydroxyglutarate dehydrogenase, mitochondrial n=1 Tax=Elliptochloris bilobata TaxID=381761 RepID=A0AAW1R4B6_9CHLO
MVWLDAQAAKALEPELRVYAALHSPSTGIVDSHSLMLAYQADAERHGATVALNASVVSADVSGKEKVLRVRDAASGEESDVRAREVVNAAGLHAPAVAACMAGLPQRLVPRAYFARGHYFSLQGKTRFRHLIYPLPEHGGLGVHLTLDMAGAAKFGPDVEWVEGERYAVDPARADTFYPAIRTYFPGLPDGALAPAYSGIRPKVSGPGQPSADFIVQGAADHGVPGLVNLFGIESPGLTSSLALADLVVARLVDSKL